MTTITDLIINGEKYKHVSTLAGGTSLYRTWKYRGKIPQEDFEMVAGGLYLKANREKIINEQGVPRKPREVIIGTKIKQILKDLKSKRSLIEDLTDLVIEEGLDIAKSQRRLEKSQQRLEETRKEEKRLYMQKYMQKYRAEKK